MQDCAMDDSWTEILVKNWELITISILTNKTWWSQYFRSDVGLFLLSKTFLKCNGNCGYGTMSVKPAFYSIISNLPSFSPALQWPMCKEYVNKTRINVSTVVVVSVIPDEIRSFAVPHVGEIGIECQYGSISIFWGIYS